MKKNQKHKLLYVYEERIPEDLKKLVLDHIPGDEFEIDSMTYKLSDNEKIAKLKKAEVVLFAPGRFLSDEVLSEAKHIKLMQLWSSGYDKFNVASCTKYGIPVSNNGGANACSVAEHAILLMLAVYKWLPDSHKRTVTGNWTGNSHGMDMFMLSQKTIGIIGLGNIGKQVAQKLSGFGANVVYYDINRADPETEKNLNVNYVPLEELFKISNIITLHLHSNDSTRHIIDKKAVSKMKKGVVLINVSRAELVDQDILYDSLVSGHISGAGIDVYTKEPTDGTEPVLNLLNVVATPHMAGSTYDTYMIVMKNVIDNFRRVFSGEKPLWAVNKK